MTPSMSHKNRYKINSDSLLEFGFMNTCFQKQKLFRLLKLAMAHCGRLEIFIPTDRYHVTVLLSTLAVKFLPFASFSATNIHIQKLYL